MRCVCGREVRPPWRFYRDVALAAAALVWGLLVARQDRDAKADTTRARALGQDLRERLDSIHAGKWVQLRDGDTIVQVVRARRWRFGARH